MQLYLYICHLLRDGKFVRRFKRDCIPYKPFQFSDTDDDENEEMSNKEVVDLISVKEEKDLDNVSITTSSAIIIGDKEEGIYIIFYSLF